jgi:poly(A) polymerase
MNEALIYSFQDHQINSDHVPDEAKIVVRQLKKAGFEAYLVGGSVRDLCLGKKPHDFDIATSAQPEQVKPLFRNSLIIGRRFRLVHIRFKKMIIELATFRSGDTSSEDLIIHDNTWGSPQEDALRRDFTINGLFYDVDAETILDFVGGFEDLRKGLLATIGDPALRFRQDPVRMLRLIKFKARYPEMIITPECFEALQVSLLEIHKSSSARLLEEILRMLESGYSAKFFHLMSDYGLLEQLMPHLHEKIKNDPAGRLIAFLETCDQLNRESEKLIARDVLFGSLVYSLMEQRLLQAVELKPNLRPHELASMAQDELESMTGALRQLPKRMRACIVQIISLQLRLSPIEGRSHIRKKARLLTHPDFGAAFGLLEIRSHLDTNLSNLVEYWRQAKSQVPNEYSSHKTLHTSSDEVTEASRSLNNDRRRSKKKYPIRSSNNSAETLVDHSVNSEAPIKAGIEETKLSSLLPPPARLVTEN